MKIIWGISKSCFLLLGKHPGCSGLSTGGSVVKNQPAYAGDTGDVGLILGSGRSRWRRKQQPTPIFLPGKFYGQRGLAGHSPWDTELDTTERVCVHSCMCTHTHTHTHTRINKSSGWPTVLHATSSHCRDSKGAQW